MIRKKDCKPSNLEKSVLTGVVSVLSCWQDSRDVEKNADPLLLLLVLVSRTGSLDSNRNIVLNRDLNRSLDPHRSSSTEYSSSNLVCSLSMASSPSTFSMRVEQGLGKNRKTFQI